MRGRAVVEYVVGVVASCAASVVVGLLCMEVIGRGVVEQLVAAVVSFAVVALVVVPVLRLAGVIGRVRFKP